VGLTGERVRTAAVGADGKSPQGNWRLAVNDDAGGDAGSITCFEVEVKYKKAKKKRK
jgi:subtilisin-like proprotein convertase family protein